MTPFSTEEFRAWAALLILGLTVYSFVRERIAPDVTSLLAILALLLAGVLTPAEAFSGLSHPATVSVAAVLVLSAGLERTGAMSFLAARMLAPLGGSEILLTLVLMVTIGITSAFVNNTAAVAVFIPAVLEVCRRTGARPGRLLMPMAHAATLGGMCTLIGTSTNLAAHEYARTQGLAGFGMFEPGLVGLPMLLCGFLYILFVGRLLLPRTALDPALQGRRGPYVAEVIVLPGSGWIGGDTGRGRLERDFDVQLVEVMRKGQVLDAESAGRYEEGDRLLVRGPLNRLLALGSRSGLELHRPVPPDSLDADEAGQPGGSDAEAGVERPADESTREEGARMSLAEIVVLPGSWLIGSILAESRFVALHDALPLAIHRPGEQQPGALASTRIRAGDVLVVEGTPQAIAGLGETRGFLVIGTLSHPEERPGKVGVALATLVGVVLLVSLGWAPIVTAATAGCALLILTGCLKPQEAYLAIDWRIVFLLAGALALGTSLEKTGIAEGVAASLGALSAHAGPWAILATFFVVAVIASEMMSNTGTVLLLSPVAISVAKDVGMNPMALVVAVTFGASAAFSMPIGYQTSLMIYGPGGYRFRDYLVMGLPLNLLLACLALWLIPRYWPLTP
jgi:di/tricarboxylate transporter